MIDHGETLARMEGKIDLLVALRKEDHDTLQDHEARIRPIERGNWISGTMSTVATAVMAAVLYKLR